MYEITQLSSSSTYLPKTPNIHETNFRNGHDFRIIAFFLSLSPFLEKKRGKT